MAVTQQLARITAGQLGGYRRSVDALDGVCSFAVAPQADHLDLDRAPAGLLEAARLGLPRWSPPRSPRWPCGLATVLWWD